MAWEPKASQRYYIRKKRSGRRVVSEYIGHGPLAELIAAHDEERRAAEQEQREAEQLRFEQVKARTAEIDGPLDAANDAIMDLVAASLLLSGYHRHKGQWRKKSE
jgi:hypothetical protein